MQITLRRITSFIVISMLSATAYAKPMSFEEAKKIALDNSNIIKSFRAKQDAAEYKKKQAVGGYMPKLSFKQTFMRTDEPANAAFAKMAQGEFDMTYFTNQLADPDYVSNHQSKLLLVQPVFMQGKLIYGIKQAKEAQQASKFETERVTQFTLFNLHRAYFGQALAKRAMDVVTHSYNRTQRYYKTAQDFYKNGLIVKSDLLVSESYLLMNEQAVKDAEKQLAVATSQLQRILAVDEDIETEWSEPKLSFSEDLGFYAQKAMLKRQDLSAMKNYLQISSLENKKSKTANLPSLALFADYQRNDEEVFGDSGEGYTYGAVMEFNIFNGFSDINRIKETKSSYYSMLHQIADKKLEIKSEVKNAYYGTIAAVKQIEASKKRVEAAQKALEITENRFNEGLAKVTELLDREVDLKQAELSLYMSEFQQIVELAGLHLAVGTLE